MSNIEPTEEQKQAATAFARGNGFWSITNDLARLLAEREAKLREEVARWRSLVEFHKNNADIQQAEVAKFQRRNAEYERRKAKLDHDIEAYERGRAQSALLSALPLPSDVVAKLLEHDTLRARVAELDVHANTAMNNRDAHKAYAIELEERVAEIEAACVRWRDNAGVAIEAGERATVREAQHLADIKALRHLLQVMRATRSVRQNSSLAVLRAAIDAALVDTAHYDDDAKADAPASTEGEATDE